MPHEVDVRCPACAGRATFEFAEVVQIRRKEDIAYFAESPHFEYRTFEAPTGSRWHAAIFYAGLHGSSTATLSDLPDGYAATDWDHAKHFTRTLPNLGSIRCDRCVIRRRHELRWPDDAFFRVDYQGGTLWAFDVESAQVLRAFIAGGAPDVRAQRWANFLRHIPARFLSRRARRDLPGPLDRLLREA